MDTQKYFFAATGFRFSPFLAFCLLLGVPQQTAWLYEGHSEIELRYHKTHRRRLVNQFFKQSKKKGYCYQKTRKLPKQFPAGIHWLSSETKKERASYPEKLEKVKLPPLEAGRVKLLNGKKWCEKEVGGKCLQLGISLWCLHTSKPSSPSGWRLSRFLQHKDAKNISTPPWMWCKSITGLPSALNSLVLICATGWRERHCKIKLSWPKSQLSVPSQGLNLDRLIQSRPHLPCQATVPPQFVLYTCIKLHYCYIPGIYSQQCALPLGYMEITWHLTLQNQQPQRITVRCCTQILFLSSLHCIINRLMTSPSGTPSS